MMRLMLQRGPRYTSLRFKLIAPLLIFGVSIASLGAWAIHDSFKAKLNAQLMYRGETVASSICCAAQSVHTVMELQQFVSSIGAQRDVVLCVVAADNPDRVLVASPTEWVGQTVSILTDEGIRKDLADALKGRADRAHSRVAGKTYTFTQPLQLYALDSADDALARGAVTVHLDASSVRRQVLTASWTLAALLAAVIATLCLLAYALLNRMFLRPVTAIRDTMALRAEGHNDARAVVNSRDEIGVMARTLNCMFTALDRKEADLKKAKEAAEAADIAKSEFLANMSHEIRTPMTAILGFAENLLESNLSEPDRLSAIRTIQRNGEHLLSIINDILDLSKIEAGRMVIEKVPCSPCQIIADVASLMKVRADTKRLLFNIEYMGPVPETIHTDPNRLRQILINLVGNAIKFTDEGGVRLVTRFLDTIQGKQQEKGNGPWIQFDVLDTGIGMNPEQAQRLFQPFVQADPSMARRFGGTGLGLVISRRFAEMLGGSLAMIETGEGRGTAMRVTIATGPLNGVRMLEHPLSATYVSSSPTPSSKPAPDLHGVHVLLAEDGIDNQRLIAHMLRKAGAMVTIVDNGQSAAEEAVQALDGKRMYDVILMDMQMPVMDGYEAASRLRQQGYPGAIVALTAHAMASDREKCINAGCNDYTTKPIDRIRLLQIIRKYVTPARGAATPAEVAV